MARKKESAKNTNRIAKQEMEDKEKKELDELYQYVRTKVMNYDNNQSLPRYMVRRLIGLTQGKYIVNNLTEQKANYSYSLVLTTFKYCSMEIKRAIQTKQFKNEIAKFNYIIAIVENKLNDVYKKMKQAERIQKKQEMVVVEKALSEPEYVHIFKAPEQKKLSADLEALI